MGLLRALTKLYNLNKIKIKIRYLKMSDKKKSILEEAILDAKRIQEALNSNTKEILRSLAKEEIDSLVKESLEEDYMEEDVEDDADMDDMDVEDDADMDDMDDEEIEIEDPVEDDDLEGDYDTEMDAMPSDEVEMDMTAASDDEVLKIYKKLTDSDEIEVVVDDNEIELSVNEPGDFLIKMDDSEGMDDEPMDMDVANMEPMEPVGDMDDMDMDDEIDVDMDDEIDVDMDDEDMDDDEEEVMYEIDLGEMEENELMDECDLNDEEGDPLEEKISQNAVDERRSGGKLTSTKASGAKQQAKFLGHKVNESKIIKKYNVLLTEAKQLKNKNEEYKGALRKFRTMLAETVVFNSNLTYVTKLFMEHSTTKQEKESVFKRFDNEVSTLKESKQLYKRIASEFGSRKPINESINKKLIKSVNTGVSKQLTESTAYVDKETSRIIGLMKRVDKR
tara:strand:+ start:10187 stop:11530 length:1344 start_codon:yes stop_codon:yes gene_type:complete